MRTKASRWRASRSAPGPHALHGADSPAAAQSVLGTVWKENEPSEVRVREPLAERYTCLRRDRPRRPHLVLGSAEVRIGAPAVRSPFPNPPPVLSTPVAAPDAARLDRKLRTVCPAGRRAPWGQVLGPPGPFPKRPRGCRDCYGPLITGVTSRHMSHAHSALLADHAGAGTTGRNLESTYRRRRPSRESHLLLLVMPTRTRQSAPPFSTSDRLSSEAT